ncbi:MAG: ATP-dependent DNA ligase [Candidatus Thermoplasmatota archaeon]|nr:ATP-dependent DNA ligase [Candidatus Thermoplasmatota archaeon]
METAYEDLVRVYEKIEGTPKRLEMTDHLVELFTSVPPEILDKVVYLTQGKLLPDFYGKELGLAGKLIVKTLTFTTGIGEEEILTLLREKGDIGLAAQEAIENKKQTALFANPLTVERVYGNFMKIADASGSGSQDLKMKLLAELLHDSTQLEAKYIVKSVAGSMRIGIADLTMIDALAVAFATKERRDEIERAYNVWSDLGRVAKLLAEEGEAGLDKVHLELGTPIRAMLCERLSSLDEIFEKLGECAFEYKYDGLRIQAHISEDEISLFSRRLEDVTEQFPDIVSALRESFRGKEGIVEGEAVPVNLVTGKFLPFQEVSHRRGRIHGLEKAKEEYPVRLFLFDCLHLDGEDLLDETLTDRRKKLWSTVEEGDDVRLSTMLVTENKEEVEGFFQESLEIGGEGLIAKALDSPYVAGTRGWNWIKFKKEYEEGMVDTVDLVIVGALAGRGRRAGTYGALLMAAYDAEDGRYKTVCKLGTGFDDITLAAIPDRLEEHKIPAKDPKVVSDMKADFWFSPEVVLEVLGAEITRSPIHTAAWDVVEKGAGLALRFPRFTGRWREDKGPEDATTVKEIVEMYEQQEKVKS